jgi:hypothetical protein
MSEESKPRLHIQRGYWKCDYYAWLVQPAWRVCKGGYQYGEPIAGPYRTRREAREAHRALREKFKGKVIARPVDPAPARA